MFVPFVNFVMPFVLGAKGSAWAWENKQWESVGQFKAVQRKWAKWGVIVWVAFGVFFVALFFMLMSMFKDSEAYKLAVTRLEANPQVEQSIGKPFDTGTPMGSIEITGPTGKASLSFSINGPRGDGTVYLEATKRLGQWHVDRLVLHEERTGRRFDLGR